MTQAPEPALPLAWPADLSPDRLAITEANRAAAAWLAAPGLWPVPVTLVVGPAGSGKTHLARWFSAHHRASVIDGAQAEDPERLFHAWNAATPLVRLGEPDDERLAAVLAKLFAERGIKVGDDLIRWLVVRIERSLVTAQAVVDALDAAALARRRAITIPLAREVVDGQGEFGF